MKYPGEGWLPGYLPSPLEAGDHRAIIELQADESSKDQYSIQELTYSKSTCRQCHTDHSNRRTPQITDYMTRGDDAFSVLMKELINHQPGVDGKEQLPNRGKKVMVFSDSRSRAAKLAKNVQDNSNYDEMRLFLIHTIHQPWYQGLHESLKSIHHLYSMFILNSMKAKLEPFASTGDDDRNARSSFAMSRIEVLAAHAAMLQPLRSRVTEAAVLELIDQARDADLGITQKSDSYFDDFYRAAPVQDPIIFPSNTGPKAIRWGTKSHRGFIKKVRREFVRWITTGVKNNLGENLTNSEKNRLAGYAFVDEFYENGKLTDETFEQMLTRLSELGPNFSFDGVRGEEIDWHPLYRARAIICGLDERIKLRKKGEPEDKFRSKMNDVKEAVESCLQRLHTDRTTEQSRRYHSCKAYLLSNPKNLTEIGVYAESLIRELVRKEMFDDTAQLKAHWDITHNLAQLSLRTPWEFSSAIFDFIGSKDFSLNGLGLGFLSVSEDLKSKLLHLMCGGDFDEMMEKRDAFSAYWDEGLNSVLTELVNWMTRPAYPSDSAEGKETRGGQRSIKSESGAYSFSSMKSHRSVYNDTIEAEWGIPAESCELKYDALHKSILGRPPELSFIHLQHSILLKNNHADDTRSRMLVNANAVSISLLENENQLKGCPRCATMIPVIHEAAVPTSCPNCMYEGIIDYDPDNTIFEQRIEEPWRSEMRRVLVETGERAPTLVLRAEEHTAQINTARDDSEMYTAAEEFELLFQDIPFAIPKEDEIWSTAQAPIDILSCTTTMEVGIDIGSLSCVALRTVPRKSSNYQQRVGRAGRGTAEVCIALSWCDNQPHAQNYFDNPTTMLRHPSTSPVIYLRNKVIIQRHINAAIFQAFFKRMTYILNDRRFKGMAAGAHEANLMESMGTMNSFFSEADDQSIFTYHNFKDWLKGTSVPDEDPAMAWANVQPQIAALLPDDLDVNLQFFVNELNEFLDEQAQQWKVANPSGVAYNE
jgi:Lhr-like helicase